MFYHEQSPFWIAERASQAVSWAWFTLFNQRGSQDRSLFGVQKYADKLSSQMRMQLLDFVRPKGLGNMIKFHSNKKKWSKNQERKTFGEKKPPSGFQAAQRQIRSWGYKGLRHCNPNCPHILWTKTKLSSLNITESESNAPTWSKSQSGSLALAFKLSLSVNAHFLACLFLIGTCGCVYSLNKATCFHLELLI